jgi:hypothetical protein
MSSRYKFEGREGVHFGTSSFIDWIDVFTVDIYRDILLHSFWVGQKNQSLEVHGRGTAPIIFIKFVHFYNTINAGSEE